MEILAVLLFILKAIPFTAIGGVIMYGVYQSFTGGDPEIDDLMRHTYTIGETGTGKSTKCKNDIMKVIRKGFGILYIDIHGKDCLELLDAIPPEHADRVIYIDPANPERVIGFPIFDGENEQLAVDALLQVFDVLWPGFIGPSTEDLLRMASLAVFPNKGTLLEIYLMLTDENFRSTIQIEDDEVRTFWRETFPEMIKKDKGRLTPPTNKLRKLIMSKICRTTLCQSKPKFDMMQAMNENKIIICNFSKGKLGHDTSRLLAALMVCKLQLCTFQRNETSTPFFAFLDEFQNYVTTSFEEIISEARKYNESLNLYHQYYNQMPPFLRHAVRGNVGSRYAFRVDDDAKLVAEMFDLQEEDIRNLKNYTCYAKRLIKGQKEKEAVLIKCPPGPPSYNLRDRLIRQSRRYGYSPDQIYADIRRRTKSHDVMEDEII